MNQEIGPPRQNLLNADDDQEQPSSKSEEERRGSIMGVVATVIFIVVFLLAVLSALYILTVGLAPSPGSCIPQGSFSDVEVIGSTSAIAKFDKFEIFEPRPEDLAVALVKDDTRQGWYTFTNNSDGVTLRFEDGTDLATITYLDFQDNERVNEGDRLMLTDLDPDSEYTLLLFWCDSGDMMDEIDFSTF